MCSPHLIQYSLPWLQAKVVRVIEAEHASCLLQLVICKALKTCLCRDRHEDGERDGSMREVEGACARFRSLCITVNISFTTEVLASTYRTLPMQIKSERRRHGLPRRGCRHGPSEWLPDGVQNAILQI
jgi:hypothetical protein